MIGAMALASTLPAVARASEPTNSSSAQDSPKASETVESLVSAFMETHHVPALSMAFARPNKLLFARAWGVTQWNGEAATTDSLFRIASVTKPMTATAIFQLIERDYLRLDDRVFGDGGLLDGEFGADLPANLSAIIVRHLLMHTAGGWPNDARGPTLMRPDLPPRAWLEWVLRRRLLQYEPGTHYLYSNVGYVLLGHIIGKLTAEPYADFIRENVLLRCNIKQMRLASREPIEGEVRYYDQSGIDPYARNMERLEACAGWLATPTDLVRFGARFPKLLQPETRQIMVAPGEQNPNVASGWSVNARGTLWHSGGIAGSNALLVRLPSGLSFAVLINTSGKESLKALNQLMWDIVGAAPAWER